MAKSGLTSHSKVVPPPDLRAHSLTPSQAAVAEKALKDLQIVFGKNLTSARLKRGLRQSEVAQQAGLTPNRISLIESGQVNLTLKTMIRLAQVVEANVSTLLRERKANPSKAYLQLDSLHLVGPSARKE